MGALGYKPKRGNWSAETPSLVLRKVKSGEMDSYERLF